ncbi:MAG: hypothetical protein LBV72_07005 [Tannerella sp.]|nr:hypothetical protein [Tannerella sp.]
MKAAIVFKSEINALACNKGEVFNCNSKSVMLTLGQMDDDLSDMMLKLSEIIGSDIFENAIIDSNE